MSDPNSCVLFLGQTGVCKRAVAAALDEEVHYTSASAGLSEPRWEAFHFEDFLVGGTTIREFVQAPAKQRQHDWQEAAQALAKEFFASDIPHRGVFLHGTYWYRGELFNHIRISDLAHLQPTCVVTLIDDVYDIHSRVIGREQEFDWGASELTLPQLVTWRWAEIGLGDLLARNVADHELPHFVIAVKHPARTLRQLLLERQRLPVYASFPITKVRKPADGLTETDQKALKEQIGDFRQKLRDARYTVLDPLTIDEYRVDGQDLLPRWSIDDLSPMVPGEELTEETIKQVTSNWPTMSRDIGVQVARRDFRMIDAADAVACYRPQAYDGKHSGGTLEELRYGQQEGKVVVVAHDDVADGGEYGDGGGPFSGVATPAIYDSLDGLLAHLANVQSERDQRWHKKPQEWA
jgi:adenylate kinase